jgi:simple sugar transport system ATP-binding protein
MSGVSKRFGATHALDGVSLAVRIGTVHALLGENGAGKTTLMRVAFGLLAPDAGTISIHGAAAPSGAAAAIAAGAGMVHQHFTNVPAMTVAENVALGGRGPFDARRAARTVEDISARTGLSLDPTARAEELPVGAQQRLEIVKALARGARLLILDEPTAVLAPAEVDELLRWLRAFADNGNSVVLITHKLREALSIADEITVLRRGRVVLETAAGATSEAALARSLLGEEPPHPARPESSHFTRDVVARARNLSVLDERGVATLRDATVEIRGGEIVGVAAVEGAGQRELLRALAGRARPNSGTLELPARIGFVPDDRHRDALVLDFPLFENVALRGVGARRGRMHWTAEKVRARRMIDEFDVRGGDERALAVALSGGNQQKLVLARELDGAPALVIVDNPTRGLDIRAARAVHDRLRDAARAGAAVVVHSSDVDEVLSLATRVLVVHAGAVRDTPIDRELVGRAMLGVA